MGTMTRYCLCRGRRIVHGPDSRRNCRKVKRLSAYCRWCKIVKVNLIDFANAEKESHG